VRQFYLTGLLQILAHAAHPLQIALENIDLDNVTQDGNHGNESPQAGQSPTEYVEAETYNTNIVPTGPEGDAANDVTVTPITGTGSVPTCDIPAFGPPPPPPSPSAT
jgi:hypothetical protein